MVNLEIFSNPEFYDIFGIVVFTFIIIYAIEAIKALKTKKSLPKWASITLLIIGILGFIIDLLIVNSKFF